MIRPPRTRSRSWPVALAAMLCVPVMNGPRYAQQPARIGERTATQDQDLGGLRYRLVGPFRGGRATTVAGVSGDPRTYYFGTAGGGVWKTTNGGQTWTPIFDGQPVGAIGDLGRQRGRGHVAQPPAERRRERAPGLRIAGAEAFVERAIVGGRFGVRPLR